MEDMLYEIIDKVSMVVAGCAGLSAFLPTTKDKVFWEKVGKILTVAPTFVKPIASVYSAITGVTNILGFNFGKAKNLIGNETCDTADKKE